MKVVNYDRKMDREVICKQAFEVCQRASFPVEYQDVCEHLFGDEAAIVKILMDKEKLVGFAVFQQYKVDFERKVADLLYLSGMVIDRMYQGKNIAHGLLRRTYEEIRSDIVALRTQNIKMAMALMGMADEFLFRMPGEEKAVNIELLKQVGPFGKMNDKGVIPDCYETQLYEDLTAIKDNFGIELGERDALGVIVEPKGDGRKLSLFRN